MDRSVNRALAIAAAVWALAFEAGAQAPGRIDMTVTNDATVVWLWETQQLLSVSVETGGGQVAGSPGGWYTQGSEVVVTAVPDEYLRFESWAGDVSPGSATNNPLSLTMDQARSVRARFAESLTGHGTPLRWLGGYGLGAGDDEDDPDEDGFRTWQEYIADTDPTNRASRLPSPETYGYPPVMTLSMTSTGRLYDISARTSLTTGVWQTEQTLPGTGTNMIYAPTNPAPLLFYRTGVRLPE